MNLTTDNAAFPVVFDPQMRVELRPGDILSQAGPRRDDPFVLNLGALVGRTPLHGRSFQQRKNAGLHGYLFHAGVAKGTRHAGPVHVEGFGCGVLGIGSTVSKTKPRMRRQ